MKAKLFYLGVLAIGISGCGKPVEPAPVEYAVNVVAGTGGEATARVEGEDISKAVAGTTIILTAVAGDDYEFVGWTAQGGDLDNPDAEQQTFTMPARDVSFSAGFSEKEYDITASETTGGSVEATVAGRIVTKALKGDEVTLMARADENYKMVLWTVTGVVLADRTSASVKFTMPAGNVSVSAKFGSTYDAGVTVGGVKWATRNLEDPGTFAAKPEDRGMLYQWNSPVAWTSAEPLLSSPLRQAWGAISGDESWSAANDPCPEGWQVPTSDDFKKLVVADLVINEWVAKTAVSLAGRKFTDKTSGNSMFFPAAGGRKSGTELYSVGSIGGYWSATQSTSGGDYGNFFNFYVNSLFPASFTFKDYAFPVRCVEKK